MMLWAWIVVLAPLLVCAAALDKVASLRHQRSCAMLAGGFSLCASWFVTLAYAPSEWMVTLIAAVALVVFGLTPLAELRNKTLARVSLVLLLSMASVTVAAPTLSALLSLSTAYPVYAELRERHGALGVARVFACYMLPSILFVAIGVLLWVMGWQEMATWFIVLGFAVRGPLVPFHSWFPPVAERGPMALVAAFFAPQLGVVAHLHHSVPRALPMATPALAALCAVTAVYTALLALAETRPRRALGYLLMSQGALVTFCVGSDSETARAGGLVAWGVLALAGGAAAMLLAVIEARRGTCSLDHPDGNFHGTPRLAAAFLLIALCSVGLPGGLGFVGEDLMLHGAVDGYPLLGFVLIVATACNGVTVFRCFFAFFTGRAARAGEHDLTVREAVLVMVLGLALFGSGLFPQSVLQRVALSL